MDEQEQAASPDNQASTEASTDNSQEVVQQVNDIQADNKESAPLEDKQTANESDNFQKRINKVTADKYAEKRRADELQAKVDELSQVAGQPQSVSEKPPVLEDFDYDEDKFMAAKVSHEVEKKHLEIQERQKEEGRLQKRRETDESYNKKVAEFQKQAPDFQEVVANIPFLPQETLDTLMSAKDGEKLAYYLGQHLDVADEVASLPPNRAALLLGTISSKLSGATNNVKVSNAPEPIETVESGGKLEKEMSQMSMEEIYNMS